MAKRLARRHPVAGPVAPPPCRRLRHSPAPSPSLPCPVAGPPPPRRRPSPATLSPAPSLPCPVTGRVAPPPHRRRFPAPSPALPLIHGPPHILECCGDAAGAGIDDAITAAHHDAVYAVLIYVSGLTAATNGSKPRISSKTMIMALPNHRPCNQISWNTIVRPSRHQPV
ncbi:serine/arginine repetitive matrix protein 1-like [Triticum dicoccoides]|uniref:serine/arginine repetitive matrix protein 1-like n=1 Tax=Triticum dicoccoides TaxID=85692 RepID=UPI00188DD560|nr:serine/arginine repetitive matrix protein 1-like [Triticum dicoccoides]